jgi:transaldolase/glucose-6-phosphate isomerase
MNPLVKLESLFGNRGQSIWLDYIRRHLIESGELQRLIDEDGVTGVTSNPAIFEKAIAGSHDYDEVIMRMAGQKPEDIYNVLSVEDIRNAADHFRPVYDKMEGWDGFVSLEVSPLLARNTDGTIQEARRLWQEVSRPNVLIKVPATREGVPAIRQLVSEGININVTLLFSLLRYQEVAEAYIAGLEARLAEGKPIDRIASVASFFLSRIDVLIDPMLEQKAEGSEPEIAEAARKAHGQVAIACAKKAYQMYKALFESDRFRKLEKHGAWPQRLLWASTSTKNPAYSDVKYVDALIGPETVNTIPMETLDAYRDHGHPAPRLEADLQEAEQILDSLSLLGFDLNALTSQLEEEGIQKFLKPFEKLMQSITEKIGSSECREDRQQDWLGDYEQSITPELERMQDEHFARRFWQKDPTLWKTTPEAKSCIRNGMGWLHVAEAMQGNLREIQAFVKEIQDARFTHVLHMGMGGSSLAPLVFQRSFHPAEGFLLLNVLDTTDPETLHRLEQSIPLETTLFIVASKSGTTAEPVAFNDYFYARLGEIKGDRAGEHFIAITDPDTELVTVAKERRFRKIFLNFKDIGGRYSALSYFGMLPAALMGIDIGELLSRAECMRHACESCVPVMENPAFRLGIVMGILARQGRDKVTFLVEKPFETLGMWLEQLLAESTGKEGRGLLPVADEPVGKPGVYGPDRLFIHICLSGKADTQISQALDALKEAGHPVIRIELADPLDLGQEFLRWEIATAVAGNILEINAFDQPNVQESKDNTKRLLKIATEQGFLPEEDPVVSDGALQLFTEISGEKAGKTIVEALNHWLSMGYPDYYIAIMAYLMESPETEAKLQEIRLHLRDSQKLATTLGYGPRFLHSTGQYHKGGPNNGLFLQLTAKDAVQVPIPGRPYDFGTFKQAEALGDFQALQRHARRVIRIDLGADPLNGLARLRQLMDEVVFSRR